MNAVLLPPVIAPGTGAVISILSVPVVITPLTKSSIPSIFKSPSIVIPLALLIVILEILYPLEVIFCADVPFNTNP